MENWNFRLSCTPEKIISKIRTDVSEWGSYVLYTSQKEDSKVLFLLRKRIRFGERILRHNLVRVRGRIHKPSPEEDCIVRIEFRQNPFLRFAEILMLGLAVVFIVLGFTGNSVMFIPGIAILILTLTFLMVMNRRARRSAVEYRKLLKNLFSLG